MSGLYSRDARTDERRHRGPSTPSQGSHLLLLLPNLSSEHSPCAGADPDDRHVHSSVQHEGQGVELQEIWGRGEEHERHSAPRHQRIEDEGRDGGKSLEAQEEKCWERRELMSWKKGHESQLEIARWQRRPGRCGVWSEERRISDERKRRGGSGDETRRMRKRRWGRGDEEEGRRCQSTRNEEEERRKTKTKSEDALAVDVINQEDNTYHCCSASISLLYHRSILPLCFSLSSPSTSSLIFHIPSPQSNS